MQLDNGYHCTLANLSPVLNVASVEGEGVRGGGGSFFYGEESSEDSNGKSWSIKLDGVGDSLRRIAERAR